MSPPLGPGGGTRVMSGPRPDARRGSSVADRVREVTESALRDFPWRVQFHDWKGAAWRAGGDQTHWSSEPLTVTLRSEAAGRALVAGDVLRFLDLYLASEADLEGNLYVLSDLRAHARFVLSPWQAVLALWRHRAFQTPARARVNVKSHYDVPQEAFDGYLDRVYRAYSCAIFEDPARFVRDELVRVGDGSGEYVVCLVRAKWRSIQEAMVFVAMAVCVPILCRVGS